MKKVISYSSKVARAGVLIFSALICLMNPIVASASTVNSGEFNLTLNRQYFHSNGVEVLRWFDAARSANKNERQLRDSGTPLIGTFDGSVNPDLSVGQVFSFDVFGTTVPSPPNGPLGLQGRYPQASTFAYNNSNPYDNNNGQIGLGGVMVMTYTSGVGNSASTVGDFQLKNVGSDWLLTNKISFTADAFLLTHVTTNILDANNFSLSGNVEFADEISASFFLGQVGDTIGTFSFTTAPVPVPGAVWLFGSTLFGFIGFERRKFINQAM